MSEQKFVRVRIAVAVGEDGDWAAYAHSAHVSPTGRAAHSMIEGPGARHTLFVEADIPIPHPQTIEGEVTS